MSKLTDMINIGKEMESKLKSVEIDSAEKLRNVGSKEAYFRLKAAYPQLFRSSVHSGRGNRGH